ncbi:hypothetical protein IIZ77_01405 [Candidatus Saccharibacteria bacterium]|nr:hypothetical protein [Candidatus Saccharibacteria bacterium]
MNNNQTTAEDTKTESTVTAPAAETTTTTSDATATDEKVTDTSVEETTDATTTGEGTETAFSGGTITKTVALKETFSATESTFTIDAGDTFTATDVTSTVALSGNRFTNNDATSAFLRATGSSITMTFGKQVAEGDIVLDNLSTLTLVLSNESYYMGIINHQNSAKSITVNIDETSQLILAGDSYIDVLENADATNQNIYSNGYKLYVGGQEVAVNGSAAPETPEVVIDSETEQKEAEEETSYVPASNNTKPATDYTPFIVGGAALLVIILSIVAVLLHNKKKKGGPTKGDSIVSSDGTMSTPGAPDAGSRPDFSAFDDGPIQPAQPQQPQAPQTPSPVAPEPPVAPAAPQSVQPIQPAQPQQPPRPRPPIVGAM